MTPLEILRRQLRELEFRADRSGQVGPGIYFLVEGDEIVYVGRSTEVMQRVCQHAAVWPFDRAFWYPLPVKVLSYYEGAFIRALVPRDNHSAPLGDEYDDEILLGFGIGHLHNREWPDILASRRGQGQCAAAGGLGGAIKAARASAGIPVATVARRLEVSRQAVYWWETNRSVPTLENLIMLADLLGTTLQQLTSRDVQ